MKHTLAAGVSAIALLAISHSADAQTQWPNWYVGISGSVNYLQDADLSGTGVSEASFDNGYGISGSIGYLPPNMPNWRFEAEIAHRNNDIEDVNGGVTSTGKMEATAYMLNAYYDMNSQGSPWAPYIGGGVGMADVDFSASNAVFTANNSDTVFAYQLMAGIGYTPATMPQTQWNVGYRFFGTEEPSFASSVGTIDAEYYSHNVEVGGKFRF